MVAVVVVEPVCLTLIPPPVVGFVRSSQCTTQPLAAVGKPMTPLEAAPPVPMLIVKAAVPLFVAIEGLVPKPEEMVGAVVEISNPVSVTMQELQFWTVRLGTGVMLATTSGGRPVATLEIIWPVVLVDGGTVESPARPQS